MTAHESNEHPSHCQHRVQRPHMIHMMSDEQPRMNRHSPGNLSLTHTSCKGCCTQLQMPAVVGSTGLRGPRPSSCCLHIYYRRLFRRVISHRHQEAVIYTSDDVWCILLVSASGASSRTANEPAASPRILRPWQCSSRRTIPNRLVRATERQIAQKMFERRHLSEVRRGKPTNARPHIVLKGDHRVSMLPQVALGTVVTQRQGKTASERSASAFHTDVCSLGRHTQVGCPSTATGRM